MTEHVPHNSDYEPIYVSDIVGSDAEREKHRIQAKLDAFESFMELVDKGEITQEEAFRLFKEEYPE